MASDIAWYRYNQRRLILFSFLSCPAEPPVRWSYHGAPEALRQNNRPLIHLHLFSKIVLVWWELRVHLMVLCLLKLFVGWNWPWRFISVYLKTITPGCVIEHKPISGTNFWMRVNRWTWAQQPVGSPEANYAPSHGQTRCLMAKAHNHGTPWWGLIEGSPSSGI